MIINKNSLTLLSLAYCPYLGPRSVGLMEKYFLNLHDVFLVSNNELAKIGLKQNTINKFCQWRAEFSDKTLLSDLQKENINFISWHDDRYPPLLKEIPDPPPILFYRGDLENNFARKSKYYLAIVGSRQCTTYAEKVIKNILPHDLAKHLTIISGLASGVDRLAHQWALDCQGRTIAVLGSGLSWRQLYPRSHRPLAEAIIKNGGCILSEFPPNTPPSKINFPRRNRLISGLANCVLVVEADLKSGSLITARCALEQGRDVLSIPGNIFWEKSRGANQLIQAGAKPILNATDLTESLGLELNINIGEPKIIKTNLGALSPNENIVYSLITKYYQRGEKITAEKIVAESKLDTSTINSTLTILELKGLTKEISGTFEPR